MKRYLLLMFVWILCIGSLFAQDWNQVIKAVASDRTAGSEFGFSVDIYGDYAIVGARYDDLDENEENSLANAGAAYIFHFDGSNWEEYQKIVPSDRQSGDKFGYSVAISDDYAFVDAWGRNTATGRVYVFKRTGTTWTEAQSFQGSKSSANDDFGQYMSIFGDKAIISAYWEGGDIDGLGNVSGAGATYFYHLESLVWVEKQRVLASDRAESDYFGCSVSISGDYAIIGAEGEDEDAAGTTTKSASGSAYIFYYNGSSWSQVQKIKASDWNTYDSFGSSVAISGDRAIVGANDKNNSTGAAYVFVLDAGVWSQEQKIVASVPGQQDYFGASVDIDGNYVVIGAELEDEDADDNNYIQWAGSAYVFSLIEGSWTLENKIVASDRATEDRFAHCVAISGERVVVGAYAEDENVGELETLSSAGSAYFFEKGYEVPLPIELVDFTAERISSGIALNWTSATEVNNLGFVIEKRKKDTDSWSSLASYVDHDALIGQGTTSETHTYQLTDTEIEPGCIYEYRLGDMDYSNNLTWKKTIEVDVKEEDIALAMAFGLEEIYPNPFNPSLTINFGLSCDSQVSLQIFNMCGQLIQTLQNSNLSAGDHSQMWNPVNITTGIYLVRLQAGDQIQTQKIVYLK